MAMVNYYAGGPLDRAAQLRGEPAAIARLLRAPETRFVPVWHAHNLVARGEPVRAALLTAEAVAGLVDGRAESVLLGLDAAGAAHFALDVSHIDDPAAHPALDVAGRFADLREVGPLIGRDDGAVLAFARGILWWHLRHRFCGVCGGATVPSEAGFSRRCDTCGATHFPRTDPAVIVLIHDGERIILGRQRKWPAGMHSVLAGFVEPGESLEDAVAREIYEEVGVRVGEVRYHSSQPWPFPASLMLGFTAGATTRDICRHDGELESARWYGRAELLDSPEDASFRLPRRDSIARRLVDDWLAGKN